MSSPEYSVTIARFSGKRAFIRLDLPAFGRPTITVVIPSRIRRPVFAVDKSSSIAFKNRAATVRKPLGSLRSSISLLSDSRWLPLMSNHGDELFTHIFYKGRNSSTELQRGEGSPLFCFNIINDRLRYARSIRPFIKARFVNSPASAMHIVIDEQF